MRAARTSERSANTGDYWSGLDAAQREQLHAKLKSAAIAKKLGIARSSVLDAARPINLEKRSLARPAPQTLTAYPRPVVWILIRPVATPAASQRRPIWIWQ
jgi:hypothetical protein